METEKLHRLLRDKDVLRGEMTWLNDQATDFATSAARDEARYNRELAERERPRPVYRLSWREII